MKKIIATLVVLGVFLLLLFLVPPILMLGGFCLFLLAVIALFYPNLLVLPIFSIEVKTHARTYAVLMMVVGVFLVGSGAWAKQLPKSPKEKIQYLMQQRLQTTDEEPDKEQQPQLTKQMENGEIQEQQQLQTVPTSVAVKIDPETQQPIVEGKAPAFKLMDVLAGDTIRVAIDGKPYTVRMLLVDTPEMGQPYGKKAKDQVRKLLAGKEIILEADQVDKNSAGHLLRYVHIVGEKKLLQHQLVKKGFARVDSSAGKYAQELYTLQNKAKKKKLRIWSLDNYVQDDGFVTPKKKKDKEDEPQPQPEKPTTPEDTPKSEPEQPYYATCNDAKQAGATPLRKGDPGYRAELDKDGDEIACEKESG